MILCLGTQITQILRIYTDLYFFTILEFINNYLLALPVGRVGWGYSKKLFINSITIYPK